MAEIEIYWNDLKEEKRKEILRCLGENGNFDVMVSRNTQEEILGSSNAESLRIRTEEANAFGADAFISIHVNASNITEATGSEAYIFRRDSSRYLLGVSRDSILQGKRHR